MLAMSFPQPRDMEPSRGFRVKEVPQNSVAESVLEDEAV